MFFFRKKHFFSIIPTTLHLKLSTFFFRNNSEYPCPGFILPSSQQRPLHLAAQRRPTQPAAQWDFAPLAKQIEKAMALETGNLPGV
jgi:hypothetical protein